MSAPAADECPVQCDADCECGQWHCAYIHEPKHKRAHDPDACPTGGLRLRPGDQPLPQVRTDGGDIQSLVIADVEARAQVGEQRYGTRLQPFNGRSTLLDAYQESLDLATYLRAMIEEYGVEPKAIPETGRVLFVAQVDPDANPADVAPRLQELADRLAPGRATVAVMPIGATLHALSDEDLAGMGLQRRPGQ